MGIEDFATGGGISETVSPDDPPELQPRKRRKTVIKIISLSIKTPPTFS
jgi:hypothetical protein